MSRLEFDFFIAAFWLHDLRALTGRFMATSKATYIPLSGMLPIHKQLKGSGATITKQILAVRKNFLENKNCPDLNRLMPQTATVALQLLFDVLIILFCIFEDNNMLVMNREKIESGS